MSETEALRQIKSIAERSDIYARYTNDRVQLAGAVLNVIKQVKPTDWEERAHTAEQENGVLRAQLRERPVIEPY